MPGLLACLPELGSCLAGYEHEAKAGAGAENGMLASERLTDISILGMVGSMKFANLVIFVGVLAGRYT